MNDRVKKIIEEHGYDYGVLVKLWNLNVDYGALNADDLELKVIQEYINNVIETNFAGDSGTTAREVKHTMKELASEMRMFLTELSTYKNTYFSNVWKAMAEIEDDYSLLQLSTPLIGYMWD